MGLGAVAGIALGWRAAPNPEAELEQLIATNPSGAWPVLAPRAPSPEALRGIPPFLEVKARPLLANGHLGPMPLDIAWFATDWAVPDVLRYYEEMYRLSRRAVVSHRFSDTSGYVAWLETDAKGAPGRGVLHMVSALHEGGQTLVFLSANDPLALTQGEALSLPAGSLIPIPPGSTPPRMLQLQDEGRLSDTLALEVRGQAPEQVIAYYRSQLALGGWAVSDARPVGSMQTLVAEKGAAQQTVLVGHAAAGGSAVTVAYEVRP